MSVMAAKAAAAKAAAAIQAQLQGAGSGADVNSKYPGMPIAWGLNMTEAQRETAYAQHTRQSRRLYVGSLPKPVTDESLHKFFNDAMVNSGAAIDPSGGPAVVNTTITHDKGFAFIEFRRLEDAESALMFDGIVFNGSKLVIKRPKDYDAARNPIWAMRGQAPPEEEVKLSGRQGRAADRHRRARRRGGQDPDAPAAPFRVATNSQANPERPAQDVLRRVPPAAHRPAGTAGGAERRRAQVDRGDAG